LSEGCGSKKADGENRQQEQRVPSHHVLLVMNLPPGGGSRPAWERPVSHCSGNDALN
jgi:hypothetical protein